MVSKASRTQNSLRNTVVGISTHLFTALFSFVSRTVFVRVLGVQYLGISGLFSNILSMLALSDLGIYTVMVYSLYGPLADRDEEKICALIRFFQRLYNVIAIIVLVVGLACIPFLPYLINNSTLSCEQTIIYYILLLLNSVCSYFAISKSTLLRADQQVHIVQTVSSVAVFGLQIMQIVILLLTREYVVYLIVQIFFTLGSNVTLSCIASKMYPYIKGQAKSEIVCTLKSEIVNNLKATFLYKIGNTIMNSTDNILISVIVGTAFVGYYGNYVTIFTMINAFVMIVIQAILPSIGNYYATQSTDKKFGMFRFLLFGFYALAAFCTSCYISGMNDFIRFWLGEEFLLSNSFVWAVAFSRFVFCAMHPLWMTRESTGVFVQTKYVMICAALVNIILSVALGLLMGITGIILATAVANLLTVFWYEPRQLCRMVFDIKGKQYWMYLLRLLLSSVPPVAVAVFMQMLNSSNLIIILTKFLVCGIVTFVSFYVLMGRSEEKNKVKLTIESILTGKKNKYKE